MRPGRQLVQVDDPVPPAGRREGGHEAVAPGEPAPAAVPVPQLVRVAAAVRVEPVHGEPLGRGPVQHAALGARADDLDVVAEVAQHVGGREEHHLAATDLAVVGGEDHARHGSPPVTAS